IRSNRIGDPDIAVGINFETVWPDEHPTTEARHYLAVRAEFVNGVRLRIAAFVAESSRLRQRLATHHSPNVTAIAIDVRLADGSNRPPIRKLRPAIDDTIRIRQRLRQCRS